MISLLRETASSVAAPNTATTTGTMLASGQQYNPMAAGSLTSVIQPVAVNCNQIRTKIRNFLGTKELTQSAFLKLDNINSNSYYRFKNLRGSYTGCDNQ
ncbi:hypothetical protein PHMEG_00037550, partial [Phytophthora megakarya]